MNSSTFDSSSLLSIDSNYTQSNTSLVPVNAANSSLNITSFQTASSSPQILTVNSTADIIDPNDGKQTLREAIELANTTPGSAIINFDLGAGPQTITLTGGQFKIQDTLIINGTGKLTINGNSRSRIFEIDSNVSVTMSKLNLIGGSTASGGGAILNHGTASLTDVGLSQNRSFAGGAIANSGSLYLTNTTIHNNLGYDGGGINNIGYLNIRNSTFSNNSAALNGGGIYSDRNASVDIQSSTFTLNSADSDNDGIGNGGGIYNTSGRITVQNTIIANNFDTPNNSGSGARYVDVSGAFIDLGYNLIGDGSGSTGWTVRSQVGRSNQRIDPKLTPLRDHGGFTQTHALLQDSPAMNAGNASTAPATDQRGIQRTQADIGAYEARMPVITVDILADEEDGNLSAGDVSLREAIRFVNDGGIVNFAPNLQGVITLNLGELRIGHNISINGPGAKALTVSGNYQSRVFVISPNITVDLKGLSIAKGDSKSYDGVAINNFGNLTISEAMILNSSTESGSIIFNGTNASLNLYHSTVAYNSTDSGVILNYGTMTVRNSTFSNNGGLTNIENRGFLDINASTIAGHSQLVGIQSFGTTQIKNSIVEGGLLGLQGDFISQGYNLIGNVGFAKGFIHGRNGDQVGTMNARIDLKLDELKDNGGSTWTRALLAGSPALNAANPFDRPQTDQRGVDRGTRPDIGAYENAAPNARFDFVTVRRGGSVTIPVLANDSDFDGDPMAITNYSKPLGGRLILNANSTFTYQSRTAIQNDTFRYTITDGKGATSTATVQIRIV